MRRLLTLTAIVASTSLVGLACGGDDGNGGTGPSATYENIAGTYAGVVFGTAQGIDLNGTFTLTITQNQGTLGGSYGISGTLDDGVVMVPVQGTGTISGTIASGNNPSVNVTTTSGVCPNVRSTFSGTYDSANRRISVTGSLKIFDGATCQVELIYSGTITLSR